MTTRSSVLAAAMASFVLSATVLAQSDEQSTAAPSVAQAGTPASTAPAPLAAGKPSYSNKWRIEVSEGANSDGEIIFHVTPEGGTAQVVKVAVENGTSENQVARVIEAALEAQLGDGKYDIEIDDGEDVLVKKRRDVPMFALQLASSTVKSVRLEIEKE